MPTKKEKVVAETVPLTQVNPKDILDMYGLFCQYYDNVEFDTFVRDLNKKRAVIMIRERKTRGLRGFSTITEVPLKFKGRSALGVFSGDTIMHKDNWGSSALQGAFFKYMLTAIVRNPHRRVFWLLISKGYKTYLLLANNWDNYYPRIDKPVQPEYEAIVESYCAQLWPGKYDKAAKVLNFGPDSQCLKGEVTPITDHMRSNFPKIAFFEKCNPNWEDGVELPCVGEAKISNALTYGQKFAKRLLGLDSRRRGKDRDRAGVQQPMAGVRA
jgi:hypothetical protein